MKLSTFLPLALLAPFAVASPIETAETIEARDTPKNTKTILADLSGIVADIKTLNNTLNTFKPDQALGLFTALKIQRQTSALGDALGKAVKDTSTVNVKFTKPQAGQVAKYVVQTLNPATFSLLDNIVAHKPAFATAVLFVGDLTKTVHDSLVKQKAQSNTLGLNIGHKLVDPYAALAGFVNADVQQHFAKAIKKYNTCTGVLCLPSIPGKV